MATKNKALRYELKTGRIADFLKMPEKLEAAASPADGTGYFFSLTGRRNKARTITSRPNAASAAQLPASPAQPSNAAV